VNDCFTPDPLAVEGNASLESVARTMATQRIGCVVITENERVKGIFTTVDACRVLGEVLSAKKD
jgi:CBS domain-containing protein